MTEAQSALTPISTVSRRDGVMNEVRKAIIVGSIRPGQKLTEVGLAASLRVSRPTIREALNQLSQEGFLVQEPYKGLRVADVSPKAIHDIAVTRVALDVLAARCIYEDETGGRLARVAEAWDRFREHEFDLDPFVRHEAHIAFHKSIWVASENTLLIKLWSVTEAHITIALAHDQRERADPQRAHSVHEALVEEIMSGDLDRAEAAFVKHTLVSAVELIELLNNGD